jgi:hypothetical protein
MPLSDRPSTRKIDLPAWIALAWIAVFGSLYTWMVLNTRFPGLVAQLF